MVIMPSVAHLLPSKAKFANALDLFSNQVMDAVIDSAKGRFHIASKQIKYFL